MRIVFMGASKIGWLCCQELLKMKQKVVGIFSIPKKFKISYSQKPINNVLYQDFQSLARGNNIPFVFFTKKMGYPEYVETIKSWQPDLILAISWYYIIPKVVRDIPKHGAAGIHASLLPKYRGGAPVNWAIINGDKKTGVTFFYFDDGVDTGDIIAQEEIEITYADTCKTVYDKAIEASLRIIKKYVPLIEQGKAPRIPQDHSQATQFPQRSPEDGLIDWSKEPEDIKNFIRAITKPYPGAFTYIGNKKVTIWDADIEEIEK